MSKIQTINIKEAKIQTITSYNDITYMSSLSNLRYLKLKTSTHTSSTDVVKSKLLIQKVIEGNDKVEEDSDRILAKLSLLQG